MSEYGTKTPLRERVSNFARVSGEDPRVRLLGGVGVKVAAIALLAAIGGTVRRCADNLTDFQESGITEVLAENWDSMKAFVVSQEISTPRVDVELGVSIDNNTPSAQRMLTTDPVCSSAEPHEIVFGDRIYNLVRDYNRGLQSQSAIE